MYLRRLLFAEVKKHSEGLRAELESRVLELQYVQDPTDSARETWQSAQSAYEHLLASSAEKKRFFLKTAFFEGETMGASLLELPNLRTEIPSHWCDKKRQRAPCPLPGSDTTGTGGIL